MILVVYYQFKVKPEKKIEIKKKGGIGAQILAS